MNYTTVIDSALIVLLIGSSFFFSGAETALTAVSKARIFKLAREGHKKAKRVERLREQKESMIGTILMCNNVVNIVATAILTSLTIRTLGEHAVLWMTALFTVIVIFFSEILPKTIAIRHSEAVAFFSSRGIMLLVKLLSPINAVTQGIIRIGFRVFGVDVDAPATTVTAADTLRGTIQMHHYEGEMVRQERDMLGSILDLDDRVVSEVMVHRNWIEMVDFDLPADEIVKIVTRSAHSRIPFWSDEPDNVIGVLHGKDLLRVLAKEKRSSLTRERIAQMLIKPWFIPDSTTLKEQLLAFRLRRRHFAIVVDEYGAMLGIVTLEDIIEEIVGSIDDEHDHVVGSEIVPLGDGMYRVSGTTTVRDLNRHLDWNLPDEMAATVGGFILHEARAIPEQGAEFAFHGYRFVIDEKSASQIVTLRIGKLPAAIEA